jgi:hypothetical protein
MSQSLNFLVFSFVFLLPLPPFFLSAVFIPFPPSVYVRPIAIPLLFLLGFSFGRLPSDYRALG